MHIDDREMPVPLRDDRRRFIRSQKYLLRVFHRDRTAINMNGKRPKGRVSNSVFEWRDAHG